LYDLVERERVTGTPASMTTRPVSQVNANSAQLKIQVENGIP
jgi:hypothetical protein